MKACSRCGAMIEDGFECHINEDTEFEYDVCEQCFDSMWEKHEIVNCAGCGRWFDIGYHGRTIEIGGDTFTPCPLCGKDMVEGETKEDRLKNYQTPTKEEQTSRYVYVVTSYCEFFEDHEHGFGCLGVYQDENDATVCVINDMATVLQEIHDNEYDIVRIDDKNHQIETGIAIYEWRIEKKML